MDIINTRNKLNHILLNRIMTLRYHARRRPVLIQCIITVESMFVRAGLIFYGSSPARLHRKGDYV